VKDMLNMHRVLAPLASIMPMNAGGFGDMQNIRESTTTQKPSVAQKVWLALNEKYPHEGGYFLKSLGD
jgi:hypothetical protein